MILRQHQRRRNLLGSPKLALVPASGFWRLFGWDFPIHFDVGTQSILRSKLLRVNQTVADLILCVNSILQQKLMLPWVLSYIMQLLSARLFARFGRVARLSATTVSSSLDVPGLGKNR